ncbi:MAG TPA: UDP-N-acetylmuramate--L-alanine ligase [Chloroflexota bacterium]|nr:UDP-N-acetylmuramate--L-alanine ligase [Chloroflexota bacterium]
MKRDDSASAVDLDRPLSIHFVGIGGTGMSALATVLLEAGHSISGCDLQRSEVISDLVRRGALIQIGHDATHVYGVDLVVMTSAVPDDTPEVGAARQASIPVIKRAELLGLLTRRQRSICVAGTHGKTTTSAMLALALTAAGRDPTVLVGGVIPRLGSGARLGHGDVLVAEADEYDGSFLRFSPEVAIVTNVEPDHLDFYGSLERIEEAFTSFLALVPPSGARIVCWDDPWLRRLSGSEGAPLVTYGLEPGADWQAKDIRTNDRGGNDSMVWYQGVRIGELSLAVPGCHNVANALAAVAACAAVRVDFDEVARALIDFDGVRRRFELKGSVAEIKVFDDYAHHPTEVRATLAAARERTRGHIWCVFQPHTYHRTAALFDEFASAFGDADKVVITEVYSPAGREQPDTRFTSARLVDVMNHRGATYIATLSDAAARVAADAQPGDLILTMGAGPITQMGDDLLARLNRRFDVAPGDGDAVDA